MNLKSLLLVTMVSISIYSLKAQDVSFGYDNAGNRTSRQVLILVEKSQPEEGQTQNLSTNLLKNTEILDSNVLQKPLLIYPNPTEGKIELMLDDIRQNSNLNVFSTDGVLLIHREIKNKKTSIDLSSQPNGIYYLYITTDNNTESIKIVKQ